MTQPFFAIMDGEHSVATRDRGEFDEANLCLTERGQLSELDFEREALRRGWIVCTPRGGTRNFDAIITRQDSRPILVQVKRARRQRMYQHVYAIRCCRRDRNKAKNISYSSTAFDVLAAHLCDVGRWVFYTRAEIGNRTGLSFALPNERKSSRRRAGWPAIRDPDNWELLDEVAQSFNHPQQPP